MKTVTDLNNIVVTVLKFSLHFRLGHYIAGDTLPFFYVRCPVNYTCNRLTVIEKIVYI